MNKIRGGGRPENPCADSQEKGDDERPNTRVSKTERRRDWLAALALGAVSFVIVAVLSAIRISGTQTSLSVSAESITMQLRRTYEWSGYLPLDDTGVRFYGLSEIEAPGLGLPHQAGGGTEHAWLHVLGPTASLRRLRIGEGATIELDMISQDAFQMRLYGSRIEAAVDVGSLGRVVTGFATDLKRDTLLLRVHEGLEPEEILVRADESNPEVHSLRAIPSLVLRDLDVEVLDFTRVLNLNPRRETEVSTIRSGTVSLPDVSKTLTLRTADRVVLKGVSGQIIETRIDEMGFHLIFEGNSTRISIGRGRFEKDVTPSWLEYAYHRIPASVFIGAVAFVWGMLWRARKRLFRVAA